MVDDSWPPHVLAAMDGLAHRAGREMGRRTAAPVPGMRGTYGKLLALLPTEGERPAALARRARVTRQAVAPRLREMTERRWIEQLPDPTDGRAVIVRRTPLGDDVLHLLESVIADIEQDWAAQVGAERYAVFRAVLDDLAVGDP